MRVQGLHHITLVSSNAQRTVDFYTKLLGQRLVKQTVNFDDPSSYHLYFGDRTGAPGSAITFFEWPHAPRGRTGIGGTHHLALRVADYQGLLKWKRRLTDAGVRVNGPLDRSYFQSLYFSDPDGVILEIATDGPGMTIDESLESLGQADLHPPEEMTRNNRDEARIAAETWPEPVPMITKDMALLQGMHHISAIGSDINRIDEFLGGVLQMRRIKKQSNFDDPNSAHWYWGNETGAPGTLVTYFERSPENTRQAELGTGLTHHYALAVADEESLMIMRDRLVEAGVRASPVVERVYFKSVYSSDPDGHIVELATAGPGFAHDEDPSELGQKLMLPPWMEAQRAIIEARLKPLVVDAWQEPED